MKLYAIILVSALLTLGCCGILEPQESVGGQESPQVNVEQPAGTDTQVESPQAETPAQPTGDGIIVDVAQPSGGVAHDQQDCATLTSDCSSCVAKENCGWCKRDTAGCFYGDENGPIGTATCAAENWATTLTSCQAPAGGGSCGSKTNCADCLSGEGCKWCIQGSVCADASDGTECFGTWMTESYQCNYASR